MLSADTDHVATGVFFSIPFLFYAIPFYSYKIAHQTNYAVDG